MDPVRQFVTQEQCREGGRINLKDWLFREDPNNPGQFIRVPKQASANRMSAEEMRAVPAEWRAATTGRQSKRKNPYSQLWSFMKMMEMDRAGDAEAPMNQVFNVFVARVNESVQDEPLRDVIINSIEMALENIGVEKRSLKSLNKWWERQGPPMVFRGSNGWHSYRTFVCQFAQLVTLCKQMCVIYTSMLGLAETCRNLQTCIDQPGVSDRLQNLQSLLAKKWLYGYVPYILAIRAWSYACGNCMFGTTIGRTVCDAMVGMYMIVLLHRAKVRRERSNDARVRESDVMYDWNDVPVLEGRLRADPAVLRLDLLPKRPPTMPAPPPAYLGPDREPLSTWDEVASRVRRVAGDNWFGEWDTIRELYTWTSDRPETRYKMYRRPPRTDEDGNPQPRGANYSLAPEDAVQYALCDEQLQTLPVIGRDGFYPQGPSNYNDGVDFELRGRPRRDGEGPPSVPSDRSDSGGAWPGGDDGDSDGSNPFDGFDWAGEAGAGEGLDVDMDRRAPVPFVQPEEPPAAPAADSDAATPASQASISSSLRPAPAAHTRSHRPQTMADLNRGAIRRLQRTRPPPRRSARIARRNGRQ